MLKKEDKTLPHFITIKAASWKMQKTENFYDFCYSSKENEDSALSALCREPWYRGEGCIASRPQIRQMAQKKTNKESIQGLMGTKFQQIFWPDFCPNRAQSGK